MRVISGEKRHLTLNTLDDLSIRPTTDKIKETLFNIIQFELNDINFLDLFAGSGAIGIEALSRGSRFATFVDNNLKAIKVIDYNLEKTDLKDKSEVCLADVIHFIQDRKNDLVYHIVFLDPPYNANLYKQVLNSLSKSSIIDDDTIIIVESSIDEKFDYVNSLNFDIIREKKYKTNKHIFLRKHKINCL